MDHENRSSLQHLWPWVGLHVQTVPPQSGPLPGSASGAPPPVLKGPSYWSTSCQAWTNQHKVCPMFVGCRHPQSSHQMSPAEKIFPASPSPSAWKHKHGGRIQPTQFMHFEYFSFNFSSTNQIWLSWNSVFWQSSSYLLLCSSISSRSSWCCSSRATAEATSVAVSSCRRWSWTEPAQRCSSLACCWKLCSLRASSKTRCLSPAWCFNWKIHKREHEREPVWLLTARF